MDECREQALEVSGWARGSGASSATGHRSILACLLELAVHPSSRSYKWPGTQSPGHHRANSSIPFKTAAKLELAAGPPTGRLHFPIQSMCAKLPEPIFKG